MKKARTGAGIFDNNKLSFTEGNPFELSQLNRSKTVGFNVFDKNNVSFIDVYLVFMSFFWKISRIFRVI